MRLFLLILWAAAAAALPAQVLQWQPGTGYRFSKVSPPNPGKVGFTLLSAEKTGIRFTNYISIETAARNQNLLSGAGVAAGDFDNDGLCDLFFCSLEGRNTLYRNLGNWKFEDVTERAGVVCPGMFSTGALFADMNGDGLLDLLVTGNNGPNALFQNLGNGRFTNITAAAGLTSKPLGSTSMAAADLDGNGTLDLFVANYGENTVLRSGGEVSFRMMNGRPVVSGRAARRLKIINGKLVEFGEPSVIYLNDGAMHFKPLSWMDGTFRDEDGQPLKELPNDLSLSVMMRDIDGDGNPDIYVCNDFQTPDRIWMNDGHAHFRALPRLAMRCTSSFSMGIDFADFDRDGHDDFFVADMLSRWHSLRMTQMADTNMAASPIGMIDDRPQIRRNTLFHNRGDGTYAEMANFAGVSASDWTWMPAFLDVDLDGYEDILANNGHLFDTQDLDATDLQLRGVIPAKEAATKLKAYPKLNTPKYAFRNRRDGTFEEVGQAWGFDVPQVCHGLVFADLDNDGDLDVIMSSANASPILYRNDASAPRICVRLKGKAPNTKGISARITVRGGAVPEQSQEVVAGGRYLSSDEPVRSFAAGSLTNKLSIQVRWRNGTVSSVRDAVPNAIYEIDESGAMPQPTVPRTNAPAALFKDVSSLLAHRHEEKPFDDFERQPLMAWRLSQGGPGVAWFDLDGDGHEQLFIGAGKGGRLSAYKLDAGKFSRRDLLAPLADDLTGLAGWVRQPGKRELIAARSGYEAGPAAILSLAGAGADRVELTGFDSSPGALAVADYDGDGSIDLFVAGRVVPGRYPEPASSRLYHNRGGQLVLDPENSSRLKSIGLVTAATWSDLDGDGWPDLIVTCEWGPIRIFKNTSGTLREVTRELGFETLTGWWSSVAIGDFDGDGRLDIVAGNWGLNSWYQAAPENPVRTYWGDFNGDNSVLQVDAEFDVESRKIAPRENLTMLAPMMPFLRARFPTHASFRAVSVSDMLGDRFAAAHELTARTLASTLFLNRGDRFQAVPLSGEAQLAPIFGISVADADGDGNEDVFLAQNFFATRKDIPRLDAGRGLWLRGDGHGNLTPMFGQESGVIVWGEQRGAATADYDRDGRIDLVVSQNGGETKLFHNETARPGLRVRVKGAPGNPDGYGVVLRLKYASGLGPAHEIHGGSGYWSQDGAVTILGRGAEPTHVIARWPGGRSTETPVPAGASEIVVELPGKP